MASDVTAPDQPKGTAMDIRRITPDYAVSPQIDVSDLAALKAAGFALVIDNRPDGEIGADQQTDLMRAAAAAAGLDFVANPVVPGAMTLQNVQTQRAAMDAATGPVFAYCASGNRSSVMWALAEAKNRPVDELVGLPARFGYQLDHLRAQLTTLAKSD
jgi:uncharacterized protein (TIGR01244 family)